MEWKDLSGASKCVLERCWGLYTDDPKTYSVPLGMILFTHEITVDTYKEIMKYQKHFPEFDVKLEENVITVSGRRSYGSWLKTH